jgi:hypothetical protein
VREIVGHLKDVDMVGVLGTLDEKECIGREKFFEEILLAIFLREKMFTLSLLN